jgi:serine/threonine protein kinase
MEFIEGHNLDEILQQRGMFLERDALAILNQVLNAVEYLHANRIIHRDIKPQNIILTSQGKALLVDFGIAKQMQTGYATLSGARAATPGFAAPEQYRGGTDQRSDIYSLGALLYTMLTSGAPPDALALEKGTAILVPPRQINSAINPAIEHAVLRAMNLNPAQRFDSIGVMRQALSVIQSQFTSRQTSSSQSQLAPTVPVPAPSSLNLPVFIGVIASAVLVVVLAGMGLLWTLGVFSPVAVATSTPTRVAFNSPTVPVMTPTVRPTAVPTLVLSPTTVIVPTVASSAVPTVTATRLLASPVVKVTTVPTQPIAVVSPTPNVPPGVYVTNVETTTAPANWYATRFSFQITFFNNTGMTQTFLAWHVKFYRCPEQCVGDTAFRHSFGESDKRSVNIAAGTTRTTEVFEIGVGGCDYVAMVYYSPVGKSETSFTDIKGASLRHNFSRCN